MARVRKIDKFIISTQNVIPQLVETSIDNVVMLLAAGGPAIPEDEYTVSGKTITWDAGVAGYNLEIGDIIVADYEYDDGLGDGDVIPPYDPTDSVHNPVLVQYDLIVIEINIVPSLIHVPVADTLIVKVNGNLTSEGVEWTRSGKVLTWISGTTLNINDVVYVEYRRSP